MTDWHYAWNGEKLGPVPLSDLQALIDEGTLEPTDLVWTSGMTDWQPAGAITQLQFPEEPPPLPEQPASQQLMDGQWDSAMLAAAHWFWNRKPVLLFLGLLLFGTLMGALVREKADEILITCAAIPTMMCGSGLLIIGLVTFFQYVSESQRRTWLVRKWEPTHAGGSWIQFSQDCGFVREDGFGAKYQFDTKQDTIELSPVDGSEKVTLPVVLLSEKQLAVVWDGTTLHYEKSSFWKRIFS